MRAIFFNDTERRVRAGWRLLVQFAAQLAVFFALYETGVRLLGPLAGGEAATPAMAALGLDATFVLIVASFASIATVWLVGRWIDRRRFRDFGWRLDRAWWLDLVFGLALGAVLMAGVFTVQLALGWVEVTEVLHVPVPGWSFAGAVAIPVALFILVGIQEELVVRGYQIRNLMEGLGSRLGRRGAAALAIGVTAAWFGLNHAPNPHATVVSTFNITMAGVMLGLAYVLTGQLALPIGLHITWNLFQGNVFGFPVSGLVLSEASVVTIAQSGPERWTGGAFGPEAGLVGTAAVLAGTALIVAWVRWRRGTVGVVRELERPPVDRDVAPAAKP